MGMNRARIEEMKQLAKLQKAVKTEVKNVLPAVYACIAKVLYDDKGMDGDEIAEIFGRSQELWTQSAGQEKSMIEWCEETTGILLMSDEYVG